MDKVTNLYDKLDTYKAADDPGAFKPFQALLTAEPEPPVFPVDALGPLKSVAVELSEAIQVPIEVTALSLLTSVAVAVQASYDVEIDGRQFPCSLFGLTILESGGRKSEIEKHCTKPIVDLEIQLQEEEQKRAEQDPEYRALDPQILSPDPTIEGVIKSFEYGQKSQGLFSSEGGMFFGGYGMNRDNLIKTISGLSRLWDGGEVRRKRSARGEGVFLHGCRLSAHLMVQPSVFQLAGASELLRQQGLLGRMLIAMPKSLRGQRLYKATNIRGLHAFNRYQCRLSQLLVKGNAKPLDPEPLGLSVGAAEWWVDFYNQTEVAQASGRCYEHIPEATSKIAEIAARIACILSGYANTKPSDIDEYSMQCGVLLAQYFLDTQLYLFSPTEEIQDRKNANRLWGWIETYLNKQNKTLISKRDIQNRGPSEFRDSIQAIQSAMTVLVDLGYFRVVNYQGDEPRLWEANPSLRHCDCFP